MTFDEQKAALLQDLKGKLFREDWHGVSDAANDLRELEARRRGWPQEQAADRCIACGLGLPFGAAHTCYGQSPTSDPPF
jgi:hypothetical protein